MDKVKIHDLEKILEPLFYHWKTKRQRGESFGNFTTRIVSPFDDLSLWNRSLFYKHCYSHQCLLPLNYQGFEKLKELVEKWEGPVEQVSRFNLKLFADRQTFEAVAELAKRQNKSAHQLAMEVIRDYVASQGKGSKGE